ncbi:MAG TPA: FAD:protein FMN transferase [Oscillospiraceae bacterium]|nr:FAD:protein FMN transferase [Oscillospiraceae bacterium]
MKLYYPAAALALLALLTACGKETEPLADTQFKLDTVVTVKLYDKRDETILDGCMEKIDDYADIFDSRNGESELGRLNEALRAGGSMEVSDDLASAVRTGLYYSELSGGAFDITIEPVSSLWDFDAEEPQVPDAGELKEAAALVDYRAVTVEGNTVSSSRQGVAIDLGAIAKGYIADRLAEYLRNEGVSRALIDLGGNILCVGEDFSVGVQKPFGQTGETLFTLDVTDASVVCSGVYQRYFEENGVRYHHLLDPKTGMPIQNGLTAVCIRSSASLDGDALSTVCFALGEEKGLSLAESLDGIEAAFVLEDGSVKTTSGFDK